MTEERWSCTPRTRIVRGGVEDPRLQTSLPSAAVLHSAALSDPDECMKDLGKAFTFIF